MDRETAIRKVLRCLRLAGSPNQNEAATALRQARALMAEYGLTEADAFASEVGFAEAKTRSRGASLPLSVAYLANVVAAGYRCEIVIARTVGGRFGSTSVLFYGFDSDARIAGYAFEVLRRQMEVGKAKHTARIRKRANREARGEAFALGWVSAIRRLFPAAEISAEHATAIGAAVNAASDPGSDHKPRDLTTKGKAREGDRFAGYVNGLDARVHEGLGGSEQALLEHGP